MGFDDERFHDDTPALELVTHEATEQIVTNDATEPHPKPEPSGGARDDRPRAPHRKPSLVHEPLGLPEHGLDVPGQHQVGVRIAQDQ